MQKINLINKKIGIYFPINNEVGFPLFLYHSKIKLYFPKIHLINKGKMYFNKINSDLYKNTFNKNLINFNSRKIKKNNWEFKDNDELIFENKIIQPKFKINNFIPEIIFVPLVAFNKECFRIGYGGGFYDKYLKNKKILKIGVASEFQRVEFINEKHDVQLDYIFTEKRIYRKVCKGKWEGVQTPSKKRIDEIKRFHNIAEQVSR